ncbi:Hsp20/alpha crystallin family protein [Nitrolancea hollandica]|uniref:Heat shock protein Hsp20 n=1 Tax=Nitrolancea hollandica Lb TaxID=1129897 RepID=I4EJP4_9BACT
MSRTEDPGTRLQEYLEEMGPPWWTRPRAEFHFPIDVQEKGNEYIVSAALPGVHPQQVHVEAQNNTLRISGEIPEEQPGEEGHWLLRERPTGHFVRTVTFPTDVETDRAQAEFRNGMLVIELPKSPAQREIPIRTT